MLKFRQAKIMEGNITSDFDHTMLASRTFDNIVNMIQNSCLNFQIQFPPFGQKMSLKFNFKTDKIIISLKQAGAERGQTKYKI